VKLIFEESHENGRLRMSLETVVYTRL